eukprot:441337-Pelagomonas_calceolata.AAC.1
MEQTVDTLNDETWTILATKALKAIFRACLTPHDSQLPAAPFAIMSPLNSNLPNPTQIPCHHGNVI